jgi:hypothetical protein
MNNFKSGFFHSFDALLGLIFCGLLVGISFSYINSFDNSYLNELKMVTFLEDYSISLKNSNLIDELIISDFSVDSKENLINVLSSFPNSYCVDLTIFDADNNPIFYIIKPNCVFNQEQVFYSSKSFVVNKNNVLNFYYLKTGVWLNGV